MSIFKGSIAVFFICFCQLMLSQTVEISGKVDSKADIENIHVINKTAQVFTITNSKGEFKIKVSLHDTLSFSSVQFQPKQVVVDRNMILFKAVRVTLDEQINELDEVIIGKVLTGNLLSDIKNVKGDAPINFYDVGIPGYTGKPATQSERRLSEASSFSPKAGGSLNGAGGSVSATAIINAISGRTKMLKARVRLEEAETLMQSIKGRLANDFFVSNPLDEDFRMDFFYFCADDENFIKYCKNETDFKILIFLRHKYKQYMENLKASEP
ncbi:carboxypeptidase-like regulatory domain-containing protein [Mariniflexile gromovii]|uniref:Carboxypeptidase-like regulatory domain-containing protein n=1 Tax=Mariniflexile gromovii TaxID=362523 RepID=A0ABS4BV68_9FLAO|nr:carboxypeptidase-like regulatory domain-containing protein [Mariniflexile gromovii]MBP0904475.1 carboxypeptidase-like regulatory domain-containing protein [Mariniflexile gromovii]